MILYDTPGREVLRTMLDEWEKVGYFMQKNEPKVLRYFNALRAGKPNLYVQTYTVPSSKNTYTVISQKTGDDTVTTWNCLKVDGDNGMRKVMILKKNTPSEKRFPDNPAWILNIYTGHFLSRYRERTGAVGAHTDELIARFLQKNHYKELTIPAFLVNHSDEDESEIAIVSEEGLSFARTESFTVNGQRFSINENKTFVSKDNLYYRQAVSIMSTDYMVKRLKLQKAQEEGASVRTMMAIMNSGFYEPKH